MRIAPLALAMAVAGVILAGAPAPSFAQDAGTRIIIRKPAPKSYLDPGTVVKPNSTKALDYVGINGNFRYPSYGADSTITGTRWPLPSRFDLPGY